MRKTNKKGFTIVELVIVIAVIGILAAVLIPTFSGVIENANNAAFKANLKAAYTQYVAAQAQAGKDVSDTIYVELEDVYYPVVDGNYADVKEEDGVESVPANEEHTDGCDDVNKDHNCDICTKKLTECVDADDDDDHACDFAGCTVDDVTACADADANDKCDECDADMQ